MPKCETCDPGTTPAIIQVGQGLVVSGAGTPSSPTKIELAGSGAILALSVRDSPTIHFTITGSGSPIDPYVLSGDTGAAVSLTGLADYSSATPPSDGQVVMWKGTSAAGHWAPQALPAPAQPITDASLLTTGILSNSRLAGVMLDQLTGNAFTGDMNSLLVPGIYRTAPGYSNGPSVAYTFGTLVVFASGQSVTQSYWSHGPNRLYHRTKWNASDWTSWMQVAVVDELNLETTNRQNADNALQASVAQARTDAQNATNAVSARTGNLETSRTVNQGGASKIQRGSFTVSNFQYDSNTGNYYGTVTTTLNGFNSFSPSVEAISSDSGGVTAQISSVTGNSFTTMVVRRNNFATGVLWLAVGD